MSKFKEVFKSVLPIVAIVLLLNFTIAPMDNTLIIRFLIGSIFVVLGLTIFLLGVDLAITPLGTQAGSALAKTNNVWLVLGAGLILGFFISIAEPGLMVLASQVSTVTGGQIASMGILLSVSFGLAIMLVLGFLRIFYNIRLNHLLMVLYGIVFLLALLVSPEFLAISFDASGATTGILAVPFILALSIGISKLKKDSVASEEDSFGLVAIASTGAILAVMILDILSHTQTFEAELATNALDSGGILDPFVFGIVAYLKETFIVIAPLLVMFFILQKKFLRLNKRTTRTMLTGFLFAFIGMFLFLLGVNAGFMDVGTSVGHQLALLDNKLYIVIVGFFIGMFTILAEPAVYVLTQQIEEVTSGSIKRPAVLTALALGVGIAISLSVIRILVPEIQLWNYIIPGYALCLGLMWFVPELFVGIAFDAGGVATGPVTATFIMAFIQGAAHAFDGADLMVDGFGMITMVAMTPIITLELLGLFYTLQTKKKGMK